MTTRTKLVLLALVLALSGSVALAWHGKGHENSTRLAVSALPESVPAFFREGGDVIASVSLDPDLFTRPIAPPELHNAESSEQFFDVELVDGLTLPVTRYEFIELCSARGIKPNKVGLLPYAVTEWTQRLTIAFAEHRQWPQDKAIQQKCLVYAGLLAHYAEDLCQPLHTSVHYDGKVAKPGAPSPRSGIHNKIDALTGKLQVDREEALKGLKIEPLYEPSTATAPATATSAPATAPAQSPLLQAVLAQIRASHALVDKTYELEKQLPEMDKPLTDDAAVRAFALERLRAATALTASLYLTAWRDSESVQLPAWHRRAHK